MEEADHLRHNEDVKSIYAKRKETIERVFERRKRSIVCVEFSLQAILGICFKTNKKTKRFRNETIPKPFCFPLIKETLPDTNLAGRLLILQSFFRND
ncbi:hypothetical protein N9I19_00540 [Peribacillus sp. CSMR9]|nr:hypothetical protein [Peribacillus sp. CSMR9]